MSSTKGQHHPPTLGYRALRDEERPEPVSATQVIFGGLLSMSTVIAVVFVALAGGFDTPLSLACGIFVFAAVVGGAVHSAFDPDRRGFGLGIGLGLAAVAALGGLWVVVV